MIRISEIQEIARSNGVTIEYHIGVSESPYITIVYCDNEYNVHIAKIRLDDNGNYDYLKIEALNGDAINLLVGVAREILDKMYAIESD